MIRHTDGNKYNQTKWRYQYLYIGTGVSLSFYRAPLFFTQEIPFMQQVRPNLQHSIIAQK